MAEAQLVEQQIKVLLQDKDINMTDAGQNSSGSDNNDFKTTLNTTRTKLAQNNDLFTKSNNQVSRGFEMSGSKKQKIGDLISEVSPIKPKSFINQNQTQDFIKPVALECDTVPEFVQKIGTPRFNQEEKREDKYTLKKSQNTSIKFVANQIFDVLFYILENYIISRENMQNLMSDPKSSTYDDTTSNATSLNYSKQEKDNSSDSGIFSQLYTHDFEQNFSNSVINVIFWLMKLPWKITRTCIRIPTKISIQIIDTIIVLTLDKLNMTKSSASKLAQKMAYKNMIRIRSVCMYTILMIVLFSIFLGFSFTVYSGFYMLMIPTDISQTTELYFSYLPVEDQQKSQIQEQQKLGEGLFASVWNDVPKFKMVSSTQVIKKESQTLQDTANSIWQCFTGPNFVDNIQMNDGLYDFSLELEFIAEDPQKFFIKTQFNSTNRSTENVNISRIAEISQKTNFDKLIQYVPSITENKPNYQKLKISLAESFDNKEFSVDNIDFELFQIEKIQIKSATLQVKTVLSGIRYIMHDWFITSAFVFILGMSLGLTVICSIILLIVKMVFLNRV